MENRPKVLDLFSGIGGFSLGLERAGFETLAFCEIDPFCRKVLQKHWPHTPIFEDIRKLDGREFKGKVDLICGGFPCQPFSVAGRKKGTEDNRDLWPEMFRLDTDEMAVSMDSFNAGNWSSIPLIEVRI